MAFQIAPLNLPEPIKPAQVDFKSLANLGDIYAEEQNKQKIIRTLAQATDASGNLNFDQAGAALAKAGLLDQARPLLALAIQKETAGRAATAQSETERHNRATEAIARDAYENPKPTVKSEFNPATGKIEFYETAPGRPVKNLSDLAQAPASATPAAEPAQPAATAPAQAAPSGVNERALQGIAPSQAALIKKIANYEISPTSLSTRGGQREFILGKAAEYDPTFDQTAYPAKQRTLGAFTAGVEGRTTRALNNLVEHLDVAEEVIHALNNGDVQAINAAKNKFKQAFGYEAPSNASAIAPILGGELNKVIVGSGTAGGIDERAQAAIAALGQQKSTAQSLSDIRYIKKLMLGQQHGLERQYEAGTRLKDFRQKFLNPASRKAMEALENPEPAAPAAPPPVQNREEHNAVLKEIFARGRAAIANGENPDDVLAAANRYLQSRKLPPIQGF